MISFNEFDKSNDVFEVERVKPFPEFLNGKWIFTANDLYQAIWTGLTKGNLTNLMHSGLSCRVMTANKATWQKGKLVIRLEFVPDPPDEPLSIDGLDEPSQ